MNPDFLKRGPARAGPAAKTPTCPRSATAGPRWDGALHGPEPRPDWVVTEHGAVDTELGMLKTGKEADVFLVRRGVPDTDRISLLAAKRYRDAEHRLFHRDAGYLEGRRVRRSREMRAMTNRTSFGRELIAGQWAAAEFDALSRLWQIGQDSGLIAVPYPVQLIGTELMLEFIGDRETGEAAPRLAQARTRRRRASTTCGGNWSTRSRCSPGPGWPTATCRRTTCWSTRGGWCSSTCRRSSTWSPTRRAPSSWPATCNVANWFAARGLPPQRRGRPDRTTARRGGTAMTVTR